LQLVSIPEGLRALDALAKEAPVEVFATGTVQPGHYLVAFGGQVEAVVRSLDRAVAATGACILDRVLLADAEARIVPAFRDGARRWPAPGDALGVLSSPTIPALVGAVDAALKGAYVELVELRVGDGLGGRSVATLWGEVHDVEAAIEAAERSVARHVDKGLSAAGANVAVTASVVPNADDEVRRAVGGGTRFFQAWRG
jgi:microcompartment protein CcmL/EutN